MPQVFWMYPRIPIHLPPIVSVWTLVSLPRWTLAAPLICIRFSSTIFRSIPSNPIRRQAGSTPFGLSFPNTRVKSLDHRAAYRWHRPTDVPTSRQIQHDRRFVGGGLYGIEQKPGPSNGIDEALQIKRQAMCDSVQTTALHKRDSWLWRRIRRRMAWVFPKGA